MRRRTPINEEDRKVTDPERSRKRTMNRAVLLLGAKPRSVGELRERLLEKMWTNAEIVDRVIEKLKEYNYLNDRQFAADMAAAKLRQKPQGKRKLDFAMARKKLSREDLEHGISTAFEQMPEEELIDAAIEKRIRLKGIPHTREDTKKFYDHLMRQGFEYGLIRTKMSEVSKRE